MFSGTIKLKREIGQGQYFTVCFLLLPVQALLFKSVLQESL